MRAAWWIASIFVIAGSPAIAEDVPPEAQGPIVNGQDMQPHPPPGTIQPIPDSAAELLRQGADSPAAKEPPVPPLDIYGHPLGGSPGLDPPRGDQPK